MPPHLLGDGSHIYKQHSSCHRPQHRAPTAQVCAQRLAAVLALVWHTCCHTPEGCNPLVGIRQKPPDCMAPQFGTTISQRGVVVCHSHNVCVCVCGRQQHTGVLWHATASSTNTKPAIGLCIIMYCQPHTLKKAGGKHTYTHMSHADKVLRKYFLVIAFVFDQG